MQLSALAWTARGCHESAGCGVWDAEISVKAEKPICHKQGTPAARPPLHLPVARTIGMYGVFKVCAMSVVAGIAFLPLLLAVMILEATASGTT